MTKALRKASLGVTVPEAHTLSAGREGMVAEQKAGSPHCVHTQDAEHEEKVGLRYKTSGPVLGGPLCKGSTTFQRVLLAGDQVLNT